MDNNLVFMFVAVIAVVIVGSIVFRKLRSNNSAKQAEKLAQERNWRYTNFNNDILGSYPQLFPFYVSGRSMSRPGISLGASDSGNARDVLYIQSGNYSGHSFTFTYTTYDNDSGNSSSTKNHFWHIVGLELPVPLPNLIIRRRRKLELPQARLTKRILMQSAELNELYSVHSEHEPFAHEVMTPEMIQWLLEEKFQNEMVMQDRRIYVLSKGRQKVANVDPMIAQLDGFIARIPAEVWQKAQNEYPRPPRVQMVQSLDLGKMKDAYNDWRDSK